MAYFRKLDRCCTFDLETGVKIIGVIEILVGVVFIALGIAAKGSFEKITLVVDGGEFIDYSACHLMSS